MPSNTFVMCTNATASCSDDSKYTEGTRTCCLYRQEDIPQAPSLLKLTLYSINSDANYVPPPAIYVLGNSTYNITPSVSGNHCATHTLMLSSNYILLSILYLELEALIMLTTKLGHHCLLASLLRGSRAYL